MARERIEAGQAQTLGRRDFLKGAAFAFGTAALLKDAKPARAQEAQGSWIDYQFWQVNVPEGKPGEQVPFPLLTEAGNVLAVTTGDVVYQDPRGLKVETLGQAREESRATVLVVDGPVGSENGGADVAPTVRAIYNWVGVTRKPEGEQDAPLSAQRLQEVVDERVKSLRSPEGGAFTGRIDVVYIEGQTGKIKETRTVYPE